MDIDAKLQVPMARFDGGCLVARLRRYFIEYIDLSVPGHDLIDHRFDRRRVGHIADHRQGLAAGFLDQAGRVWWIVPGESAKDTCYVPSRAAIADRRAFTNAVIDGTVLTEAAAPRWFGDPYTIGVRPSAKPPPGQGDRDYGVEGFGPQLLVP